MTERFTTLKTKDIIKEIGGWWSARDMTPPPSFILPEDAYVRLSEEELTHILFLYKTNSSICWVGFPTANPDNDSVSKEVGLKSLLEYCEGEAKSEGYSVMFTTTNTPRVEFALGELGYKVGDQDINQHIKLLWEQD